MAKLNKEKGFILIVVLFLLLLIALTAVSLNVQAVLSAKMTANQSAATQTYFDQLAVIEESVWQLARDPFWRPTQLSTSYHSKQYNRTVTNSPLYSDTIVISVQTPNAPTSGNKFLVNTSFRYNITTVAGTGSSGSSGDGGQATDAQLNNPAGVAVDASGNVDIADTGNNKIRKVTGTTITTIAGTGIAGFDGDGTDWFSAISKRRLNKPQGVFVDKNGSVYIADTANHRVRRVTTVEPIPGFYWTTIDTIAGTGVATDPPGSPVDNIPAKYATLNSPAGVAVDASGNVYIADTGNNRIRKVTGTTITTIAGGGSGPALTNPDPTKWQLASPRGVFTDASGVYIADTGNHVIRKISAAGIGSQLAGSGTPAYSGDGGAATAAQLSSPQRISVDGAGNIYIADTGNHRLRLVNNPGATINPGFISTMAGTGTGGYNGDQKPAVQVQLNSPGGVALGLQKAGGRIFISDTGNNRVRVLFLKTEPIVYGP